MHDSDVYWPNANQEQHELPVPEASTSDFISIGPHYEDVLLCDTTENGAANECMSQTDMDNASNVHNINSASFTAESSLDGSSEESSSNSATSFGDSSSAVSSSESSSEDDSVKSSSASDSEVSDIESNNSDDSDCGVFQSPKVFKGCNITEDEGVLVLMSLFTKYKLDKEQMGGILKSVLKFLPKYNNMPKTQYALFQYVEKLSPVSKETIHYYCSTCHYYLGMTEMVCTLCSGECHKFFQLSLVDQIRNLFECHGMADAMDKYRTERTSLPSDSVSDLLDGTEFKRARIDGQYNITLVGHTDGISVSKSSNASLWPLEFVIAEVPPCLRFNLVLVAGIWLDESKPYMNTYFEPFRKALHELYERGVAWIHPRTKEQHTSFVTVPVFCGDAPVRAQVQNILSHGGRHCCNVCEQKTKKLPPQPLVPGKKKKPRRRVFTFEEELLLRTDERMHEQGKETRRRKAAGHKRVRPEKGVKGPSVVSDFPRCDRSTVVYPEYMHLILCLLKDFMSLWFEKDGPWSLKAHRDVINTFLTSIRVPDFITRIPRSTEQFSKWKANELRSFLLYYSPIILSQCMKPEYFQHWILLVSSLYLLLQDTIPEADIAKADIMLKLFCRDFAALYKPEFYTYYVHNLCHLALSVERNGPLQCSSAFMFESFNGILAQFIHGTKNQGQELVNNVRLAFGVGVLKARNLIPSLYCDQPVIEFRNRVQGFTFSKEERDLLSASNKFKEPITLYYRALIRRQVYTTCMYTRQRKRNNYTICYESATAAGISSRSYGEIKYLCQAGDESLALVRKLSVDHLRTFSHAETGVVIKHIIPIKETDIVDVIDLKNIICKVIRVESYICIRPNRTEYNL